VCIIIVYIVYRGLGAKTIVTTSLYISWAWVTAQLVEQATDIQAVGCRCDPCPGKMTFSHDDIITPFQLLLISELRPSLYISNSLIPNLHTTSLYI